MVLDFASEGGETLVVFTSDHETGGLALSIADWHNMQLEAIWASQDHTGSVVPVLAFGPGADRLRRQPRQLGTRPAPGPNAAPALNDSGVPGPEQAAPPPTWLSPQRVNIVVPSTDGR